MKCKTHNIDLIPLYEGCSALYCPMCTVNTAIGICEQPVNFDTGDQGNIPVIDIDKESWEAIKEAARNSPWIPSQYFMNDWVSDVCDFLKKERK